MEKVTVVVPVYNAEKYLTECLESIQRQTYSNIEIILVDDGSKDSSPALCDAFQKKDNRIKVVHKMNEGAGKSRNKGIEMATGDYILFVDSDDYIKSDLVEKCVNAIAGCLAYNILMKPEKSLGRKFLTQINISLRGKKYKKSSFRT